MCVDVLVERSHYGTGVIWVLQAQSMTQLMDSNQEEVHTCDTDRDTQTWEKSSLNSDITSDHTVLDLYYINHVTLAFMNQRGIM